MSPQSHSVMQVRSFLPLVACWQWRRCHLCCILWVILLLVLGSHTLCWCRRRGLRRHQHGSSLQVCPTNKQPASVRRLQSALGMRNTDTVQSLEAQHPAKHASMYVLGNPQAEASIKDSNCPILNPRSNTCSLV